MDINIQQFGLLVASEHLESQTKNSGNGNDFGFNNLLKSFCGADTSEIANNDLDEFDPLNNNIPRVDQKDIQLLNSIKGNLGSDVQGKNKNGLKEHVDFRKYYGFVSGENQLLKGNEKLSSWTDRPDVLKTITENEKDFEKAIRLFSTYFGVSSNNQNGNKVVDENVEEGTIVHTEAGLGSLIQRIGINSKHGKALEKIKNWIDKKILQGNEPLRNPVISDKSIVTENTFLVELMNQMAEAIRSYKMGVMEEEKADVQNIQSEPNISGPSNGIEDQRKADTGKMGLNVTDFTGKNSASVGQTATAGKEPVLNKPLTAPEINGTDTVEKNGLTVPGRKEGLSGKALSVSEEVESIESERNISNPFNGIEARRNTDTGKNGLNVPDFAGKSSTSMGQTATAGKEPVPNKPLKAPEMNETETVEKNGLTVPGRKEGLSGKTLSMSKEVESIESERNIPNPFNGIEARRNTDTGKNGQNVPDFAGKSSTSMGQTATAGKEPVPNKPLTAPEINETETMEKNGLTVPGRKEGLSGKTLSMSKEVESIESERNIPIPSNGIETQRNVDTDKMGVNVTDFAGINSASIGQTATTGKGPVPNKPLKAPEMNETYVSDRKELLDKALGQSEDVESAESDRMIPNLTTEIETQKKIAKDSKGLEWKEFAGSLKEVKRETQNALNNGVLGISDEIENKENIKLNQEGSFPAEDNDREPLESLNHANTVKHEDSEEFKINSGKVGYPVTEIAGNENVGDISSKHETILRPLGKVHSSHSLEPPSPEIENETSKAVVDQIIKKAVLELSHNKSELKIHIKPEMLGSIKIHVINENQQIHAKITAETQMVKEIIEQNIDQLKTGLSKNGMEIDKIDVTVGQQNNYEGSGTREGYGKQIRYFEKTPRNNNFEKGSEEQRDKDLVKRIKETKVDYYA
ncbi:MAG: flagellar hook-length control protein FliK [Desulfobacteraceae bacterium]|nr:flagellar hook-length control protein FliK [Desulfobacteraceae bacterium]